MNLVLLFRTTELAGETGEVCNEAKKLRRFMNGMTGGKDPETARAALAEELADVIICADRVAEALDIDLSEAVRSKFNATSEKYGLKTMFTHPSDFEEQD
ncbi:MAG: nucleotide pyrophosphohydrolase [Verrucomicrobiota bacterium]